MWSLHPQLEKDTLEVVQLKLCSVRLMDNGDFPWLVMVPMREDVSELIDLSVEDQHVLTDEVAHVARVLKKLTHADKMNVAALGNMVRQLHIHVIARFVTDAMWPNPVWGGPCRFYDDEEREQFLQKLKASL